MRRLLIIACLTALPGCAVFQAGGLRDASLTAPKSGSDSAWLQTTQRYATASGPVGLAPCKKKSFPARACWRKGDQHALFPTSVSNTGLGSASNGAATPVADKR